MQDRDRCCTSSETRSIGWQQVEAIARSQAQSASWQSRARRWAPSGYTQERERSRRGGRQRALGDRSGKPRPLLGPGHREEKDGNGRDDWRSQKDELDDAPAVRRHHHISCEQKRHRDEQLLRGQQEGAIAHCALGVSALLVEIGPRVAGVEAAATRLGRSNEPTHEAAKIVDALGDAKGVRVEERRPEDQGDGRDGGEAKRPVVEGVAADRGEGDEPTEEK
eukprot:scaffold273145_cov27-Tisochrysis_lutea.AAC.6